jgi:hypothetical protein
MEVDYAMSSLQDLHDYIEFRIAQIKAGTKLTEEMVNRSLARLGESKRILAETVVRNGSTLSGLSGSSADLIHGQGRAAHRKTAL